MTPDAIVYIKESVIQGILSTEEAISSVLRDITELIARDSFNANWETLMETLATTMQDDDPMTIYRIFRTVSPIIKKIRFMSRSDTLYTQIIHVLDKFGPALIEKTNKTMEFLSSPDLSREQEEILLRTVVEQFSCYLSLNSVEEWPEFFEDNFPASGKNLNDILTKSETQNPEVLVMAKKVAVDIVNVICFKFGEHV